MKRYQGKRFAVLGDSISTLDGYSKPDEAVFYQGMKKFESDVFASEDTWWGQVIDALGGVLWANDSFSGSTVSRKRGCTYPSFSCSDERTAALGRADTPPDVIMIFMGINDWGSGIRVVPQTADENDDLSIFCVAYRVMLEKLRHNYPDAEIWCLTLPVSEWRAREDFSFPYCIAGRHINEYCEA
ncbi:MAG: hypothetical protein IJW22_00555, partial [Clostridia bacterium]|nr:hypothetical protein [Clostridia bacterium]